MLALRRYLVLWLSELGLCLRGVRRMKKQVQKQYEKNRKKTGKGEQKNSREIDPEKITSPSAITG